jgi:hypothetical protein
VVKRLGIPLGSFIIALKCMHAYMEVDSGNATTIDIFLNIMVKIKGRWWTKYQKSS